MRKTPAKVIEIIKAHNNHRNAINQRAGMSQAERIAALRNLNIFMETILNIHNCYNGFRYVSASGGPITDDYYKTHTSTGRKALEAVTEESHEYFVKY